MTEIEKEYEEFLCDPVLAIFNQKMFSIIESINFGVDASIDAENEYRMKNIQALFDMHVDRHYPHIAKSRNLLDERRKII